MFPTGVPLPPAPLSASGGGPPPRASAPQAPAPAEPPMAVATGERLGEEGGERNRCGRRRLGSVAVVA